jgi:heme exporter protein D
MTIRVPPARIARLASLALFLDLFLAPVVAVALAATSVPGQAFAAPAAGIPPLGAQTSLLVVAPHPDDETLCCAGLIRRVVAAGGHASIVWLTSGDGSELGMLLIERQLRIHPEKMRDLALRRMREARATAPRAVLPWLP